MPCVRRGAGYDVVDGKVARWRSVSLTLIKPEHLFPRSQILMLCHLNNDRAKFASST